MTVYIGVDFHARQQTVSYLTTEDGEIKRQQLDHGQPAEVRRFYGQFSGQQVVVGFESSGRAAWFEEMLEELGCEIWIGHAAAIRLFARRRQKNDRRDADLILDLLMRGDFPRIHRYSAESRLVLQQLRYRQRLVKLRTMVLNSLVFMAASRGVTLRSQLKSKRGLERLKQIALPPALGEQRDELSQLLLDLNSCDFQSSSSLPPLTTWYELEAMASYREAESLWKKVVMFSSNAIRPVSFRLSLCLVKSRLKLSGFKG